MKLIIDIPEDDYELVKKYIFPQRVLYEVVHGTPLNEQEPKTGHWMKSIDINFYKCSECGCHWEKGMVENCNMDYCPNCGARMVKPQESETWNGIHAQITAPKGTFERILNEADDDNDI